MTAKRTPKTSVMLLIRRIVDDAPIWLLHSRHTSMEAAESTYRTRIKGRGITAWAWWGPTRIAEKMLLDPNYEEPSVMETRTSEAKQGGVSA
jgi:hypothetical protein